MTSNLPELLRDSLSSQLSIYKRIHSLQSDLLRDLDSENELNKIMDLLALKSSLLDSVKAENFRSAPFVDEWIQRKEEMQNSPLYGDIELIISEIEISISLEICFIAFNIFFCRDSFISFIG